jgi:membrane-bound lytic murein transglycosylase B
MFHLAPTGRLGRRLGKPLIVVVLCTSLPVSAADQKGWGYLMQKLVGDGVERSAVERVFGDRRMERFNSVSFKLDPVESQALYRSLLAPRSVRDARRCRARHDTWFRGAEKRLGVPASVVSAILHVETRCGGYTGNFVVLHRLARLAMANEPGNVLLNIREHSKGAGPTVIPQIERKVRERARYLEDTFYPEVLATFEIGRRLSIDPLGIRGSKAGAFGFPQFLPSSFLRFAVDGDGDGSVSLYHPADAIASAANYLAAHGWSPAISRSEQRRVIWAYNRSEAYIDTVLGLADLIERDGTYVSREPGS